METNGIQQTDILSIEAVSDQIGCIVREQTGIDLSQVNPDVDLRQQVYLDSVQLIEVYAVIMAKLKIELPTSLFAVRTLREITEAVHSELVRVRADPERAHC